MKPEVINRFNAVTEESVEDYGKAKDGGFQWTWFLDRARRKAMESGYLPQHGYLMFEPRYIDTADAVLDGLLAAVHSVDGPDIRSTRVQPWERQDLEEWRQLLLTFSAMMFDAGCIAAQTWGFEPGFDPLLENAPMAVFGDLGFFNLRNKAISFFRKLGLSDADIQMAGEIGDFCVSHFHADRNFVDRAFKESADLRERYFRGVCKAAYIAGAAFVKTIHQDGKVVS